MKDNQRVALTKKLLKDGLTKLLGKMPLEKISIRELCETSGINRSTFYKYYGSQFELFEDMESDFLSLISKQLTDRVPLRDSLIKICQFVEANRESALLLIAGSSYNRFALRLFGLSALRQEVLNSIDNAEGPFADYMFIFLTSGFFNVVKHWIKKDKRESVEEIVDFILALQSDIHIKN